MQWWLELGTLGAAEAIVRPILPVTLEISGHALPARAKGNELLMSLLVMATASRLIVAGARKRLCSHSAIAMQSDSLLSAV